MLSGLVIRDIVLVERLSLSFGPGLTVLTGETGAGKSILLDALGLAIGARADSGLIRKGADRASVSAVFEPGEGHGVRRLLAEHGLEGEEDAQLVLRRTITADGRSRAHVNDQPVSVGLLRRLGDMLVEVHGQHDDRGLLDPSGHRALLDAFGGHDELRSRTAAAHRALRAAEGALREEEQSVAATRADEEYLRHALEELDSLAPAAGEEAALADERARMMQGERLAGSLEEIHGELTADAGIDARLRGLVRRLERMADEAQDLLGEVVTSLDNAAIESSEAIRALEEVRRALDYDPARAEQVEERLFALRALARKHRCQADDLPRLREDLAGRLGALERGDAAVEDRRAEVLRCRAAFGETVAALRSAREAAAQRLDTAVNAELGPLKLDAALFRTQLEPLEEAAWTAEGGERVAFEVATNPGADFGPLVKIASGGELARFILALKVSLAERMDAATLVFDEVDRNIGGATADAVGERLARLAAASQLLVVTHSPQVAARGETHLRIVKAAQANAKAAASVTDVNRLDAPARREEIARMLSGAKVTDEARAAATSLMQRSA